MKQILTLITLALLLLAGLNCGTTEDLVDDVKDVQEVETPTGSLQGEVQLIDGVSIQVRVLKAGQLAAQTETDGNYELSELEEGNYTIQIAARGYETVEKNVTVVADETVSLDKVTLVALAEPASHLQGILTDMKTGNPLADALVQLMDKAGEQYEALTNNVGVFTFENLPVDQTFTLTVKHPGYEDHEVAVKPIPADATFEQQIGLTAIPEPVELPPGQGLSIGSQAPDFELPNGNGDLHTLSDYIRNDKKVVIVFYRTGG